PVHRQYATLLLQTIKEQEELSEGLINEFSQNWTSERLSIIDKIVLKIAVAEFTKFADIPTKVTINEAIEIVKEYSTDKSNVFINGMLETILARLIEQNMVEKNRRGQKEK